jgi:homoserine dehydrogenase
MVNKSVVRVGIIGAGNVGSALVAQLNDPTRRDALLDAATGPIELVGVAVRDVAKRRKGVPKALLTSDAAGLVGLDDLDILVELAGGLKRRCATVCRS